MRGKQAVIQDTDIVHQIKNVLRWEVGEKMVLCDGRGKEYDSIITLIDRKEIAAAVEGERNILAPSTEVCLYAALMKRDNFEWVAQKVTEIGVSMIVPVITERTVKLSVSTERLQRIIREACEQSGRAHLPTLFPEIPFDDALRQASHHDINFFCDFFGKSIIQMVKDISSASRVGVLVGPEGGWTEQERDAAVQAGCIVSTLSPFVLRAETAAVAASYVAVSASDKTMYNKDN